MEEAVALARKELAPYWAGSSPLVAGVSDGTQATAHPLDPSFIQKQWLIAALDPTQCSISSSLKILEEWHDRFSVLGLEMIVIYRVPQSSLRQHSILSQLIPRRQFPFIQVCDPDEQLTLAFGGSVLPSVMLLDKGQVVFRRCGEPLWKETEVEIHKQLRLKDPGLPLRPPFETLRAVDRPGVDFMPERIPEFLKIEGPFHQEPDRILIDDPKTVIQLNVRATEMSLIGQPASRADVADVLFEFDGRPIGGSEAGPNFGLNHAGQPVLHMRELQRYLVFQGKPRSGFLRMSFPFADQIPLVLYGIRFCDYA